MRQKIEFNDVTLRDGHQSTAATRMTTPQAMRVLPILADAGYRTLELWGGAVLDSCIRFLKEDPWDRLELFRKTLPDSVKIRALLRGQNLFAYQPYPDDLVITFIKQAIESGVGHMRIFDALNDWRNLQMPVLATKAYGAINETAISYTTSPVHSVEYFLRFAKKLDLEGADTIAIKDMTGLLYPSAAVRLFKGLKQQTDKPVVLHCHTTTGVALLNAILAMKYGIDSIDTAITPFAGSSSLPPVEVLIVFAEEMGIDFGLDKNAVLRAQQELFPIHAELNSYINKYGKYYQPVHYDDVDRKMVSQVLTLIDKGDPYDLESAINITRSLLKSLNYPDSDDRIFESQIPGGMISNLNNQLKEMGRLDMLSEVMKEIPAVRKDAGYVPLVTPTSQIVGSQAAFNLMYGNYEVISEEFAMLLRGEFGRTPAPVNQELLKRVIRSDDDIRKFRPASYLSPVLENPCFEPHVRSLKDRLLYLMFGPSADKFLREKYRENGDSVVLPI